MLSPELATELRGARPVASPELRERVLAVAAQERRPTRRPRFSLPPLRRVALVAAPVAVALALGALVHGLAHSARSAQTAAPVSTTAAGRTPVPLRRLQKEQALPSSQAVPNTTSRLQQYGAFMRLQVKDVGALS